LCFGGLVFNKIKAVKKNMEKWTPI
jgi:hypothetical protein